VGAIGIFGGTFDPIHHGHLITAQSVFLKRKLDKVIFIPCFISPHKINVEYSSPEHRLNMVKTAIDGIPYFDVSDFEINKGDVSYTYNTLLEFSKEYEKIELIIGFDNLLKFDSWHNPDEILELAKLVVLKRHSDAGTKDFHKYYGKATYVDSPTIDISGTEIRDRIKKELPIDFLVPDNIREYILNNNLYRF